MRRFLAIAFVFTLINPTAFSPLSAQTVSEKSYKTPGPVEGYHWYSEVGIIDPGAMTVPYDGAAEIEVKSAERCKLACNVFASCKAFLFVEPRLPAQPATCRMLGRAPDEAVSLLHSHLYLKDD